MPAAANASRAYVDTAVAPKLTTQLSSPRAARLAGDLRMPYELARAHEELGRHLHAGERSRLGLDRTAHLAAATAGYRATGYRSTL